jgi:hypothetical protein
MNRLLATLRILGTLNLNSARRLLDVLERKPIIEISQSGWAGGLPQVHVGLISKRGATSVMTKADDDAGNAQCSLHAQSLSNITGLKVVDRRPTAKNEAGDGLGRDWVALPRDAGVVVLGPSEPTDAVGLRPATCC